MLLLYMMTSIEVHLDVALQLLPALLCNARLDILSKLWWRMMEAGYGVW